MIHSAKAQVDHNLFCSSSGILQQDIRLLQLLGQEMPVVGIARKGSCTDHQAALVGDGNTGFDTEFVGLPRFALADAFNFRGMQGIELVLVFPLLRTNSLGTLNQGVQPMHQDRRFAACRRQFPADFPQHNAEDGALAFDSAPQAPELFGVRIAASLPPQFMAFLGIGLLQGNAACLGGLHDFGTGNFEQTAVDRMGNGFLLHRGVNNDALKFCRFDRLAFHRRVDGGFQEFFYAGFTNGSAKASDLGGVAGLLGRVVLLTTEVLPHHILRPTFCHFFVTEIEGVLEVEQ